MTKLKGRKNTNLVSAGTVEYTNASLKRSKPSSKSVLHKTLNNLMVRFQ